MEKYICKIDGAEFINQEELIDYIKNTYIDTVTTDIKSNGLSVESIYKEFRDELPANVNIKVKTDTDDGGFFVNINSPICDFSCQIGEGEWNYYHNRFYEVNEAVKYYKNFFDQAEEIIGKVKEKYNLKLEVSQMREFSGEGECEIGFKFNFNENEEIEVYEFDGLDKFVDRFEQYVCKSIEGKLEVVQKEYCTEFKINGIPIEGFAKRSKKVRIEILE